MTEVVRWTDLSALAPNLMTCQGSGEAKSFAALDLGQDAVTPELAYVTARYAALAAFGQVAALLSELLPVGGARNAGTIRNRTLRVGQGVVQQLSIEAVKPTGADDRPRRGRAR